jgi:hypothetical protein
MTAGFLDTVFFYLVQGVALGLVVILFRRGRWKRLKGATAYVLSLLLIDGAARRYVYYHFGIASREYYYFYFLTDALLALGAFLLVCSFFRRACSNGTRERMWHFVRLFLVIVFALVVAISGLSLSKNYANFTGSFFVEFEENLYFTCLVLNTLLYILIQQGDAADDELGLLVCGMGLQFAGPAASFAIRFLSPGVGVTETLVHFMGPLCTLGMLCTWSWAAMRTPITSMVPEPRETVPARVTV